MSTAEIEAYNWGYAMAGEAAELVKAAADTTDWEQRPEADHIQKAMVRLGAALFTQWARAGLNQWIADHFPAT